MAKPKTKPAPAPAQPKLTLGQSVREIGDEIVFVFAIFMFINIFIVEHYQIPTGSMTPTLLGGPIGDIDINGDKKKDVLFWMDGFNKQPLIFLRQGDRYIAEPKARITRDQNDQWRRQRKIKVRNSRILVNKMAYWFGRPELGEVSIFKVPECIFKREAPIYIKRVAGEPGRRLSFDGQGHLIVDGEAVSNPDFYQTQCYETVISPKFQAPDGIEYSRAGIDGMPLGVGLRRIEAIDVPEDEVYMFGDNAAGSFDSRYWGGVPLENFKGRAFVHFWPLYRFSWL